MAEKKKGPWRFAFWLLSVYAAWRLLWSAAGWLIAHVIGGISFEVTKAATIGVIGGADGPTAVFVTASPGSGWELLLWGFLLAAGILGLRHFKKGK